MTTDATRANAKALPEMNRRRFLLNTTMAGAAVAVAAPAIAAEPEMTPHEQAVWHLRQLESLARADGAQKMHVVIVAEYSEGDCRAIAIQNSGKLVDREGLFAGKGVL